MDFELLERHPYITGAVVIIGAAGLYLILRRGSSTSSTDQTGISPSGVSYYAPAGTDPTAAALQSQEDQTTAALSATQIESQTQLGLGQLSAGVQNTSTTASADVANQQTAAQLQLGLGTINGQVALAQIQAQSQLDLINAIMRAYSGTGGGGAGNVTTSTPTPSGPVSTVTPYTPAPVAPSTGPVTTTPVVTEPDPVMPPTGSSGLAIVPGGTQLVPYPNLIPQGAWPNSSIVAEDTAWTDQWIDQTQIAQATNNRNQCLNNAALSQGRPNYAALVAACG